MCNQQSLRSACACAQSDQSLRLSLDYTVSVKETRSATMIFYEKFSFLKMVFVKVELSYVFTINLFTIAEKCMEK